MNTLDYRSTVTVRKALDWPDCDCTALTELGRQWSHPDSLEPVTKVRNSVIKIVDGERTKSLKLRSRSSKPFSFRKDYNAKITVRKWTPRVKAAGL